MASQFVLSELQKKARKARPKQGNPEMEGGARLKVLLKRDSTRGRLAGDLLGLFQFKLDGDPRVKVQIVELIKSSDNNDERDHLRVGDVTLTLALTLALALTLTLTLTPTFTLAVVPTLCLTLTRSSSASQAATRSSLSSSPTSAARSRTSRRCASTSREI